MKNSDPNPTHVLTQRMSFSDANHMSAYHENLVKIGPVNSEITGLQGDR